MITNEKHIAGRGLYHLWSLGGSNSPCNFEIIPGRKISSLLLYTIGMRGEASGIFNWQAPPFSPFPLNQGWGLSII